MINSRVYERLSALRNAVGEYGEFLGAIERMLVKDAGTQEDALRAIIDMGDSAAVIQSRTSDLARALNPPRVEDLSSSMCALPPIGGRRY